MPTPAVLSPVWLQQAAEDLQLLAWLHAAERSVAQWRQMHQGGFAQGLTLLPPAQRHGSDALCTRIDAVLAAMQGLSAEDERALDDDLAADYAAIYLNHSYRASPHESVWRDEDHLMLQAPTFAVRAFYRHHGLRVANWRALCDDHISNELAFVALMLQSGKPEAALGFLQQHLLQWLGAFAQQVGARAHTSLYALLAQLSLEACAYCAQALQDGGVQAAEVPVLPDACPAYSGQGCGPML